MGPNRSEWPLTIALCGGYFLVLLDVTVVNVALPQIGSGLGVDASGLAWAVDAYSVPLAALLLAAGAIGDRLGHRRVVLLGFLVFGAASAMCATAPTMGALIAARAVQGAGAALMLPGTLALLLENAAEPSARARLVGRWAAIGGAALPAGPVVGGLLVQAAGWRAVFWLGVPVIAWALVPVLRLPGPGAPAGREAPVDWVGAALLVAGMTCVVTAIIRSADAPWLTALLALAAAATAVAFVRVERRAEQPLFTIPPGARRPVAAACLVAGLMNLCVLGSLFLLTRILQGVHGLSPLLAGLATLPAMLPLPLLGAPAGWLTGRLGVWRTSALGLLAAAGGFAGLATSIGGAGHLSLLLFLALWGGGLGVLTPAIVTAALEAAPGSPGMASGASNTSRQAGGALGVAIFAVAAGRADAPSFVPHATELFLGSALVFVLTALLCLVAANGLPRTRRV
ncbi:MFS transporter [Nocardioides panaciterrulae]|uniref:DHA2 family methylenomycin A resistance protein-like MFS transporter n=1 Tax=Nocardioides panaciterrulae TaxID=661492 RepID=A0A7Y9J9N7_9ACTN|nr:MFS transporter [Nocardioides panaciterrulae]NYD40807.1 DHA2 family methylenomycin A resistance protein-like MFS transporter [Nocardioides panaciterrulae]